MDNVTKFPRKWDGTAASLVREYLEEESALGFAIVVVHKDDDGIHSFHANIGPTDQHKTVDMIVLSGAIAYLNDYAMMCRNGAVDDAFFEDYD